MNHPWHNDVNLPQRLIFVSAFICSKYFYYYVNKNIIHEKVNNINIKINKFLVNNFLCYAFLECLIGKCVCNAYASSTSLFSRSDIVRLDRSTYSEDLGIYFFNGVIVWSQLQTLPFFIPPTFSHVVWIEIFNTCMIFTNLQTCV